MVLLVQVVQVCVADVVLLLVIHCAFVNSVCTSTEHLPIDICKIVETYCMQLFGSMGGSVDGTGDPKNC